MAASSRPAATIHPGAVRAIFDHLLLTLEPSPGHGPTFALSHYSVRWSDDGLVGELAYLTMDRDGRTERLILTDAPALASAQAGRLSPATWDAADVAGPPVLASFARTGLGGPVIDETIEAAGLVVTASWGDLGPPRFAQGPAPRVPSEDITSTLIEAHSGRAVVDGRSVDGLPYANEGWLAWLGRPMSSCIVAIGEVLLTRP